MKNSGTQIPSLRPLSTFRPCRIRDGIRSSVTTAWPSAASVQASMIERTSASTRPTPGRTATPRSVPATIVSGRPIPSKRAGTANSRRRAGNEMREASANKTSVSVASASSFTGSPLIRRSLTPSTGPASRPADVKKIADVTTERSSRRETAENASSTNAIAASSQAPSSSPPDSCSSPGILGNPHWRTIRVTHAGGPSRRFGLNVDPERASTPVIISRWRKPGHHPGGVIGRVVYPLRAREACVAISEEPGCQAALATRLALAWSCRRPRTHSRRASGSA